MTSPVLNIADARGFDNDFGGSETFGARLAPMGDALGAKDLGVMYMEVQPGKRAFPFHNHHAKEEMFIILEGTGTYRFGEASHPIRKGDICSAPKGGQETAHQIINTGEVVLKYLSLSTKLDPDIVEYPDSGKFAALAIGEGNSFDTAHIRFIGRMEDTRDYLEGEE
ncbi:putative cupin superfamily protein [Rubricella aquisinus]|uniref:Putative cupin superfamily protein n=1 Tax=Rubricella aquisinus TaxID=2028108 RepID=A0A840WJW6_9RHOB|nr:cupin domain-containing protein [Rubricella aquisinus]MBB5514821.1 putative cupin superfamily protein [Rubricella aquisinus]